jgi:hypothetical protein
MDYLKKKGKEKFNTEEKISKEGKAKEKFNTEEKISRERKDVTEDCSWLGWRVCTYMREKGRGGGGEEWGNAHTKPCAIPCLIIHKWVRPHPPHPTQVKQLFAAARRVHFTLF